MRKIILSTLIAAGLGLAGMAGASAAPAGPGIGAAANSSSLVHQAQIYIVTPRHRARCRSVRICRVGYYGRRCHWERVCRR